MFTQTQHWWGLHPIYNNQLIALESLFVQYVRRFISNTLYWFKYISFYIILLEAWFSHQMKNCIWGHFALVLTFRFDGCLSFGWFTPTTPRCPRTALPHTRHTIQIYAILLFNELFFRPSDFLGRKDSELMMMMNYPLIRGAGNEP